MQLFLLNTNTDFLNLLNTYLYLILSFTKKNLQNHQKETFIPFFYL